VKKPKYGNECGYSRTKYRIFPSKWLENTAKNMAIAVLNTVFYSSEGFMHSNMLRPATSPLRNLIARSNH